MRGLIRRLPSQGENTASRSAMAAGACGAARGKSPFPDWTRVYMDELTFGIVTYATRAERKRSVPQPHCWNARNPNIERIRFNML